MIDKEEEYAKMDAVERELWWYKILHHLVWKKLQKMQLSSDDPILDAGCGTGGLMSFLQKKGYTNIQGIDLSDDAIKFCKQKGLKVQKANVIETPILFPEQEFKVVISNDVLCYFGKEQQPAVLKGFNQVLQQEGSLIMNLPALKSFSGIHDISVGIQHRFNWNNVREMNELDGFKLIKAVFWPFLLSPIVYFIRRKQRKQLRENPDVKIESDVYLPSFIVNNLLLLITRFELLSSSLYPFGSSLFVELKKTKN